MLGGLPLRKSLTEVPELAVFRTMVKERTGMPSFFVSRKEADDAFIADFRARCRGRRGSSRLMVLFSA